VTVDGNDRAYEGTSDVLEHGGEPGRLVTWSRKRVVRGTAAHLLMLGVLAWLIPGSGPAGSSGPVSDVGESAARAVPGGPQTPAAVLLQGARARGGEGDRECDSEAGGPEAPAGRPAGLASAPAHALVEAVRRFAAAPGPETEVPWAPDVLVLADAPVDVVKSVSAAAASQPATWTAPHLLGGLAATRPDRLRIDDEHHVTCRGTPREQAAGFEGQKWVSVQPRVSATSCRGWWAVDLYLDEQDRIEAVVLRP
jgi:hypothetical protein